MALITAKEHVMFVITQLSVPGKMPKFVCDGCGGCVCQAAVFHYTAQTGA